MITTAIDFISQPWHWSVSGLSIAFVMWLLLYSGREFGVSSNLRTMCSIAGAGRFSDFFRIDWKAQSWNLVFVAGAIVGGFVGSKWLAAEQPIDIAESTQTHFAELGIAYPQSIESGAGYVPAEIFDLNGLSDPVNLLLLVGGGFLVGFGARWAGGCTSGHAISGLANLQLPSLVAVIGFFIGGLIMTWLMLPFLLGLRL